MLTGNIRYLFLLAALLLVLLSQSSPAITVIFEAEDAVSDGPTFVTSVPDYSGTGSMLFNATGGTGLDFSVFTRDAGAYLLTIRYHSPWGDKINEIWVNGEKIATLNFLQTTSWQEWVFGNISLNEGDNIVRIQHNWGWMYVDYISLDGFPLTATDPIPENHATVSASLEELCWTNPDPNYPEETITCDVYLGTTEPNKLLSDYGLSQIAEGIEGTCVDIPFVLDAFTTYYWVVDCWDAGGGSPYVLRGYIWDFNTNNAPPEADAGLDLYVGLGNDGDPNSATVTLDGSSTIDDGLPSGTLNYLWQQLSGPAGVVIFPYDTSVTEVNLTAVGTYEFRLTVDDTDFDDTDTVLVNVYESRCEALKAQGGDFELDTGDITEDCFVGIEDLAAFLWYWLECNSLAPCS